MIESLQNIVMSKEMFSKVQSVSIIKIDISLINIHL